MCHAIDIAPCAIANFAVLETVIYQVPGNDHVSETRQRNAVIDNVLGAFFGVEGIAHKMFLYPQKPDASRLSGAQKQTIFEARSMSDSNSLQHPSIAIPKCPR
jgi:hypothetical protein